MMYPAMHLTEYYKVLADVGPSCIGQCTRILHSNSNRVTVDLLYVQYSCYVVSIPVLYWYISIPTVNSSILSEL